MKRTMILMAACAVMLAAFASFSQARAASFKLVAQDAAQDAAKQEADAYKAWFEANNAKDYVKGMELAKAFVAKFPTSKYTDYLKGWIKQARGVLFNQARQAKNIAEEIRIGKEALADDPENLDYLYLLAIDIRVVELSANPPNFAHAADAKEFTDRALKIIESTGKMPAVADKATWKQNVTTAYMHQTMGIIDQKDGKKDEALEHYKKAASLDPSIPGYFLSVGVLLYEKYDAAAKKFGAFSAEERSATEPKPEVKAALDAVNSSADAVIEYWARYLGLTLKDKDKYGQTRTQIETAVTELYKFRHDDKTDGLQDLINKYSSPTPPPSSNASN